MSEDKPTELEEFLREEMLQLKMKSFIVKKASKRFEISQHEVEDCYLKVRSKIKRQALNRGIVYLLLGSMFLFVGIKATFGGSGVIYFGGLLLGSGGILSALGFFILAIRGRV